MTIKEFDRKFPDELSIINHYVDIRYKGELICPHCKSKVKVSRYRKRPRYCQCNICNNSFSVFKGTIFEKSSTSLRIWFTSIRMLLNAKKGFSACQLQREIGVTYKTAWRIFNKIRLAMEEPEMKNTFKYVIEIDETYVGGKPRKIPCNNINGNNPPQGKIIFKRGRGTNKIPVVGVKERSSCKVYARVMLPDEKGKKLAGKQILDALNYPCKLTVPIKVFTDDFLSYSILDKAENSRYTRFSVNHSMNQYVNGVTDGELIHTNGIESHWAVFKRGYYGTYHKMSGKYLQNYVNEFSFRNNNRRNNDIFDTLLKNSILKKESGAA
jgi:transposase-like protein